MRENKVVKFNVKFIWLERRGHMKILLSCGAGMSSGFLANQVRKAAKKLDVNVVCEAKSQADVSSSIGDYDILCLGPHLAYMKDSMEQLGKQYDVKIIVIPQSIYGALDGKALLELCINEMK